MSDRFASYSVDTDLVRLAPAGTHWDEIDELREEHRIYWSERGKHWVLTRLEDIREAGHDWETFSNHSIIPTEPEPSYRFLPSHLGPPEHQKYRQLLNTWFAPQNVRRIIPTITELAADLIEPIVDRGSCDYMVELGDRYPVRVLLSYIGLPVDDGAQLVERVRRRTRLRIQGDDAGSMQAWHEIETYWLGLIADRKAAPRDPKTDIVTHFLQSTVDGQQIPDNDVVNLLVTLTIGGIDTSRAQLGWCIYHFATHPGDQDRIRENPALLADAVEELLRFYSIIGMGRRVEKDIEFHGCPMHKGDMLLLSYPSACRDPRVFPDADKVIIDREDNRHVAFGASPHRCLGSHLARAELLTAMTEWHRLVPPYRLDTDAEAPTAFGGQIALTKLPLTWK